MTLILHVACSWAFVNSKSNPDIFLLVCLFLLLRGVTVLFASALSFLDSGKIFSRARCRLFLVQARPAFSNLGLKFSPEELACASSHD